MVNKPHALYYHVLNLLYNVKALLFFFLIIFFLPIGIQAVTIGVNGVSAPPAVPNPFIWRDPISKQQVLGMMVSRYILEQTTT